MIALAIIDARIPIFCLGMNVPSNFEHIGVGAKLRRDALQFLVRLQMIFQARPSLGPRVDGDSPVLKAVSS